MTFFTALLAILVAAIWGFNIVVIEVGLKEISPLFLAAIRFFLTCVPAIFIVKRPKTTFHLVVAYGLVMFAFQFGLLFVGMYLGVPAALASLMLQFQVFFTILFALLLLGEKISFWQVLGALVAFGGIVIVAIDLGKSGTMMGFLLVMGAAASWGVGNVISKRIGKVDVIPLVVWGGLVAWPPLLILSFLIEGKSRILYSIQHFSWTSLGAVAYITYFSTFLAFGIWSWLLVRFKLATVAPFTFLVPVFGILSSVLFLGDRFTPAKIAAALFVIAGLSIDLMGPKLHLRLRKKP